MESFILPSGKELFTLKVEELKRELKILGQPTVGKKDVLRERLYQSFNMTTEDNSMEINDLAVTIQNESAKDNDESKSSIDECCSESNENIFLSDDEDVKPRRSSAIRRSIYSSLGITLSENSGNKNGASSARSTRERTMSISPNKSKLFDSSIVNPTTPRRSPSSISRSSIIRNSARFQATNITEKKRSISSSPVRGQFHNRYAEQHRKEMEQHPTLWEANERRQKRHEELTSGVNDVFQRLATPKRTANTDKKFVFKTDGMPSHFKFGIIPPEDYAKIPKKAPSSVPRQNMKTIKIEKMDVKKRTMTTGRKGLTCPDDKTFIDYISTPKGNTPSRTPSRDPYMRRMGPLHRFLDTSKLSDQELKLARKCGILPHYSGSIVSEDALEKWELKELQQIKKKLNI